MVGLMVGLVGGTQWATVTPAETVVAWGERSLSEPLDGPLTLVGWNIYKGADPVWASTFAGLAADADLLLLQEVTDAAGVRRELGAGAHQWVMGVAWAWRAGSAHGPAVGCRCAITDPAVLRSSGRELGVGTPKGIVLATVSWEGASLLVASVHGLNAVGAGALEAQLAPLRARIVAHEGPVVVGGDFNAWNAAKRRVVSAFAEGLVEVEFGPANQTVWGLTLDAMYTRGVEVVHADVVHGGSDHPALRITVVR